MQAVATPPIEVGSLSALFETKTGCEERLDAATFRQETMADTENSGNRLLSATVAAASSNFMRIGGIQYHELAECSMITYALRYLQVQARKTTSLTPARMVD